MHCMYVCTHTQTHAHSPEGVGKRCQSQRKGKSLHVRTEAIGTQQDRGNYGRENIRGEEERKNITKEELEKKKGNSKDKDYFYSIKWVKLRLF